MFFFYEGMRCKKKNKIVFIYCVQYSISAIIKHFGFWCTTYRFILKYLFQLYLEKNKNSIHRNYIDKW